MNEYIEKVVLSCAADSFKGKDGQPDKVMYRLYIAGNDGRVGFLYSATQYAPGDVIKLGLTEKDGKLRLKLLKD